MVSPLLKSLRLTLHLLHGALIVLFRYRRLSREEKAGLVTWWAGAMLDILAVRVRTLGQPPQAGGALVTGNHVSWLDIHVLHSLLPVRFISKAEVRGWPLIGWLAEAVGTVFLMREKKADAMRVNQAMGEHLRSGEYLALFPEGTTSDGKDLLPFFTSLFQPAVDAQAPVWPLRIRYLNPDGSPCDEAAYYGDMTMGGSLKTIMKLRELHVEVVFLPPIQAAGRTRRDLAHAAETAIRGVMPWANAAPDSAPGTTAHPPV